MPVPELEPGGCLPAGIHAASLAEVRARFGAGSAARQRQGELLRQVVEGAKEYPTIKIENEQQLQYSIQSLAKMYDLCERIAAQTIGDPETREDEIEGIESMIRKIEREVAEYLAKKYALVAQPAEAAA